MQLKGNSYPKWNGILWTSYYSPSRWCARTAWSSATRRIQKLIARTTWVRPHNTKYRCVYLLLHFILLVLLAQPWLQAANVCCMSQKYLHRLGGYIYCNGSMSPVITAILLDRGPGPRGHGIKLQSKLEQIRSFSFPHLYIDFCKQGQTRKQWTKSFLFFL